MAEQKALNAYIFRGVVSLLKNYEMDGEQKNLSYSEVVEALQYTIDSMQKHVPLDFTQLL